LLKKPKYTYDTNSIDRKEQVRIRYSVGEIQWK
jgi:hypothetical protein